MGPIAGKVGAATSFVEQQSQPSRRTSRRVRLALIAAAPILLVTAALAYNYQLLRASVILAHNYERPIVLRTYEHLLNYHVQFSEFTIPGSNGPIAMRMYVPTNKRDPPPMVLVHGLVPTGNRHEYMNDIGQHLAKVGFLVVLPTLPAEVHFEMRQSDMTVITDVIRWTAQKTGQQVSLVGNSFSGGLIVPAAVQPSVAGKVKVIFCNSGYYSLDKIGRYYIRDRVLDPYGRPYPSESPGPLIIAAEFLNELVPAEDVPNLTAAIDGFHANDGYELPPDSPVMKRLTPRQWAEFQQIKTASSPEFRRLYHQVLERHHQEITAISPSSVLKDFKIPLYVLHSSRDPVFPQGEVEWIRKMTEGNPNVHILVSPWIEHVKVGLPATAWQKYLVIRFCAQMLKEASQVKWVSQSQPRPLVTGMQPAHAGSK
jgi:pimeloyl-ACP methyl ester carboxylesterase